MATQSTLGSAGAPAAGETPAAGAPCDCYVLFDGSTDAMALLSVLKAAGVGARVSPTPRLARSECGTSLLVACDDRARIEGEARAAGIRVQRIVALPRQIDARRDRFC